MEPFPYPSHYFLRDSHYLKKELIMSLIVNEIFHSIQGESLYTGIPCIFIRLTGCNLRCTYCDTEYAYSEGETKSIESILKEVEQYNCRLVELTGGEPLLQVNTPLLIEKLLISGYKVLIETNGSIDIGNLNKNCIKIIDIKCPSSGESQKINFNNINKLSYLDQLKFVIKDKKDYEFTKSFLLKYKPEIPESNILLSSVAGELDTAKLAEWIIKDGLNVRLQMQMHKIIWPNIDRGV